MNSTVTSGSGVMDGAGSQLIGLIVNHCLFGLLVAQVFTYHTTFPNDHIANKTLVQAVFLLETVQTIMLSHHWYITFVLRFGDPLAIWAIQTSWFTIPILSGIISSITQVFYADRIYKISKCKGLSATVLLLAVVQLTMSVVNGAIVHQSKYLYEMRSQSILALSSIWLLSTVICDILIAVSMTSLVCSHDPTLSDPITPDEALSKLLRFRRDFHIASSRISKLISLTVETGTLTASVASITGIFFLARPGNQWYNVPAYILGKLYTNSLMRVLNNRVKMGNGYSGPFLTTTPELTALSSLSGQDPMGSSQQFCSRGEHIPSNPNPEGLEKGMA